MATQLVQPKGAPLKKEGKAVKKQDLDMSASGPGPFVTSAADIHGVDDVLWTTPERFNHRRKVRPGLGMRVVCRGKLDPGVVPRA